MPMKFRGLKALRAEFPKGSVVQVKLLTERNSWIEVEAPISAEDGTALLKLAIGSSDEAPPTGSVAEVPRRRSDDDADHG